MNEQPAKVIDFREWKSNHIGDIKTRKPMTSKKKTDDFSVRLTDLMKEACEKCPYKGGLVEMLDKTTDIINGLPA